MKIELINETDYKISSVSAQKWVEAELEDQKCKTDAEVEISVVSPKKIRELNKKYRKKDAVTDVLSFPLYDKIPTCYSSSEARSSRPSNSNDNTPSIKHLGSIVVCAEVARKQANDAHHPIEKELEHLIRHSVKHLLGKHHRE